MPENGKREIKKELEHLKEMLRHCLDLAKKYKFRARLYKKRIEKLERDNHGKCDKHNRYFERIEVKEHPGKTLEICPLCKDDYTNLLQELFQPAKGR
jgi:hypothetical protein